MFPVSVDMETARQVAKAAARREDAEQPGQVADRGPGQCAPHPPPEARLLTVCFNRDIIRGPQNSPFRSVRLRGI